MRGSCTERERSTHLAKRALSDDLDGAEVVEAEAGAAEAEEARLCAAELLELAVLAVVGEGVVLGEALFEVGAAGVALDGVVDLLLVVVLELELGSLGLFERVLAEVGAAVKVDVLVGGRGLRGLVAKEGEVALLLVEVLLVEAVLVLLGEALLVLVVLLFVRALVLGDERGDGAAAVRLLLLLLLLALLLLALLPLLLRVRGVGLGRRRDGGRRGRMGLLAGGVWLVLHGRRVRDRLCSHSGSTLSRASARRTKGERRRVRETTRRRRRTHAPRLTRRFARVRGRGTAECPVQSALPRP